MNSSPVTKDFGVPNSHSTDFPAPTSQKNPPESVQKVSDTNPGSNDPVLKWLRDLAFDHKLNGCGAVYCYEIFPQGGKHYIRLRHQISSFEQNDLEHDSEHNSKRNTEQDAKPEVEKLQEFWRAKNANSGMRLVIVEDISNPLMEILSSALDLDPLIFIQHLKGSGVNMKSLDRFAVNDCIDAFQCNHVFSAQWYRPVHRLFKSEQRKKGVFPSQQGHHASPDPGVETPGLRLRRLEKPLERERNSVMETNIFRDAWQVGKPLASSESDDISIPAAWEEKATVYRETRGGVEFVVILTDPLPILKPSGTGHLRPNVSHASDHKSSSTGPLLPYKHIAARWTYQPRGRTNQSAVRDSPKTPRSAHTDIMSWVTNQCSLDIGGLKEKPALVAMKSPIEAIFRVIFFDTMTLSDVFDNSLQEIRLASLEDTELEASIGIWRQMLIQAQLRLPTLQNTIHDLTGYGLPRSRRSDLSPDFRMLLARVRRRIAAVTTRAREIDVAFRAELSVLESRKQLLESSSVTRLTELAFFFVPLSFVASTFSMQVREFENSPPLSMFFLVAFCMVFLAYVLRFFLASRAFGKIGRETERGARYYGQIQDSQPVPTSTYMLFMFWNAVFYFSSVYGVVLASVGAVIWLLVEKGQQNSGFKAMLSVVIALTLPLAAAAPVTNEALPGVYSGYMPCVETLWEIFPE
ncbi:hypothetical protein B0T16DRAFT_462411 [Cercophora newfieldiana]|uniref:Uncharacterized protein n=1 Tax=Cercophora newfieldiana TaxID=92897 RepID=A0AA39XRX6_9PEZI|nr:hypothetical protein B0T16DRAFT_462411 [Cercophora newfieldiana]